MKNESIWKYWKIKIHVFNREQIALLLLKCWNWILPNCDFQRFWCSDMGSCSTKIRQTNISGATILERRLHGTAALCDARRPAIDTTDRNFGMYLTQPRRLKSHGGQDPARLAPAWYRKRNENLQTDPTNWTSNENLSNITMYFGRNPSIPVSYTHLRAQRPY